MARVGSALQVSTLSAKRPLRATRARPHAEVTDQKEKPGKLGGREATDHDSRSSPSWSSVIDAAHGVEGGAVSERGSCIQRPAALAQG